MRSILTIVTCLFVGVAFAQQNEDEANKPTQEQIEVMYKIACDPTLPELKDKEVAEMRGQFQTVLKDGQAGLDKLIKEGEEQDIGPLGAILACSVIDMIKEDIAAKGCKDDAGVAIDTKAAVELCSAIVAGIKEATEKDGN